MNEQQLQTILSLQQALATAAAVAAINSLLNPQQQAATALTTNTNALTDQETNDLQQQQQQQQQDIRRQNDNSSAPSPATATECSTRIQDLLLQLQQQAAAGSSPLALNLNLSSQQGGAGSPINRSPAARLTNKEVTCVTPTTSNNNPHQQSIQASPVKKLKRQHHQSQQAYHNRSPAELQATSKPQSAQHSMPKNHHHSTNANSLNRTSGNTTGTNNSSSSSSSSAFIPNNVGLPRKLVRGQDVWLGRGAEQTRQILKCMWCGQSFRTLAEMTQHMRVTQHYTNIVSQEQITSWRQPESDSAKHNKQSAQVRSLDDNYDESSDKFNDSDREDAFSNDPDDTDTSKEQQNPRKSRSASQTPKLDLLSQASNNKRISTPDNNSAPESNHEDSPRPFKSSPGSKPLTRSSRKRNENDTSSTKHESLIGRENSPTTSSSSQQQQRQNSSSRNSSSGGSANLILGDLNEDSESNKECRTNGNAKESSDETVVEESMQNDDSNEKQELDEPKSEDSTFKKQTNPRRDEKSRDENDPGDEIDEGDDDGDQHSESASTTTEAKSGGSQKGETGDPLSALETMVEKSFDPRLRPGVANGGILQRLGIDEEVCPPWQHINYANWYAAAAYGHPMAAALLAAGINLQNGIKLSKNVGPKKNED